MIQERKTCPPRHRIKAWMNSKIVWVRAKRHSAGRPATESKAPDGLLPRLRAARAGMGPMQNTTASIELHPGTMHRRTAPLDASTRPAYLPGLAAPRERVTHGILRETTRRPFCPPPRLPLPAPPSTSAPPSGYYRQQYITPYCSQRITVVVLGEANGSIALIGQLRNPSRSNAMRMRSRSPMTTVPRAPAAPLQE
jgi:hypothetical protein